MVGKKERGERGQNRKQLKNEVTCYHGFLWAHGATLSYQIPKLCILLFSQALEVTESSGDSWRVHADAKKLICRVRGLFGRKEYDSTGKQNGQMFSFKMLVSYSQKINLFQIFDLRAWRLGNTVSFK